MGNNPNEAIIKMSPGKTHLSNGTPDRLRINIFFNERFTIIKINIGTTNNNAKLGINLFCHSQSRLFKSAVINPVPFRQIQNLISHEALVFLH